MREHAAPPQYPAAGAAALGVGLELDRTDAGRSSASTSASRPSSGGIVSRIERLLSDGAESSRSAPQAARDAVVVTGWGCYPGVVERGAVLRWIAGHRAAERRSLELMREEGPMSPESSFRAAMELCDLAAPMEHDPVRDREIEEARRLWAKLKRPWAARRA